VLPGGFLDAGDAALHGLVDIVREAKIGGDGRGRDEPAEDRLHGHLVEPLAPERGVRRPLVDVRAGEVLPDDAAVRGDDLRDGAGDAVRAVRVGLLPGVDLASDGVGADAEDVTLADEEPLHGLRAGPVEQFDEALVSDDQGRLVVARFLVPVGDEVDEAARPADLEAELRGDVEAAEEGIGGAFVEVLGGADLGRDGAEEPVGADPVGEGLRDLGPLALDLADEDLRAAHALRVAVLLVSGLSSEVAHGVSFGRALRVKRRPAFRVAV
jgi:hypothetical protein